MKLSEAIRLGAMLKPQGFSGTGSRECPETCAFGAALDAMSSDSSVTTLWKWLKELPPQLCPQCGKTTTQLFRAPFGIVVHLNNDHLWTRERIADFVSTIEPSDVPVVHEQPCAAARG